MPTNLTVSPAEGGLIHVIATFTDEDTPPQPVTPSAVGYKLTDANGVEIKARATVTPAPSVTITLQGTDLDRQGDSDDMRRAVLVDWTYTSDYGTDLHDQDEARFTLTNLWAVS